MEAGASMGESTVMQAKDIPPPGTEVSVRVGSLSVLGVVDAVSDNVLKIKRGKGGSYQELLFINTIDRLVVLRPGVVEAIARRK